MVRIFQIAACETLTLGIAQDVQDVGHEGNGGISAEYTGVEESEVYDWSFVFSQFSGD